MILASVLSTGATFLKRASLGVAAVTALAALPAHAGTLYADTNSTLYSVNETTGALTTVQTGFTAARGIAVDPGGNVYVADFATGNVTEVGGPFSVTVTGAYGLAFTPSGNLVVSTDSGNVNTYNSSGSLLSSTSIGGNLTDLGFAANGDLLVSARNNGAGAGIVTNVTANTQFANLGTTSTPNGPVPSAARGITTVNGKTFVNDSTGVNPGTTPTGQVFEFDQAGNLIATLFAGGANSPEGSVYDPATGLIYYAAAGGVGAGGSGIYSYDPNNLAGGLTGLTGSLGTGNSFRDVALSPVPEPGSMLLLGTALIGLSRARRSSRKISAA